MNAARKRFFHPGGTTISATVKAETFETRSLEETFALGRSIASSLGAGDVVALRGELGAGKTVLARAIAEARGCRVPVTSPTFTLIHEYPTVPPLYHIDLYRLQSETDALDIGIEDYLNGRGICLVEWAERIEPLLPPRTWFVSIEILSETSRRFLIRRPC